MQLKKAIEIASSLEELLKPYCHRIAVAGSIRRKKEMVKDIEIVCIPITKMSQGLQTSLFNAPMVNVRLPEFIKTVDSFTFIKGQSSGKYMQRKNMDGHVFDIFTADFLNWGYIKALRTGSKEYNFLMIASLKKAGYECKDGYVWRHGKVVPVDSVKQLFDMAFLEYIEPEKRERKVTSW